ncbi:MAG: hypothetical protein E2O42_06475 [Nitrospina sp.]|nr:MAG: hypothetical protein E2O43_03845 [Nitrospina sp.]TDJ59496.1 MAG: hypothetical protein E2O42_06475 [Nitrospina sp.]
MTSKKNIDPSLPLEQFPFPLEWIKSHPDKVEEALARMSVAEQVRSVQMLRGQEQLDLLILSRQTEQVVRLLPEEDIYYMIKEIGEEDAIPVLALLSTKQLQYVFDMEWWRGDKFVPQNALDWLRWVAKANDQLLLDWILTEDFDLKVMVLQSLIKVFKPDEMTDQYDGVEDLEHFTLDGVFDIFVKVPDAAPLLKNLFKLLYADHQKVFFALMEAVIWYPITPTVEVAYRWWRSRVEEKGIVGYEEAIGVYSLLDSDSLKLDAAPQEAFEEQGSAYAMAPVYPLADTDPATFFGQCLAMLKNHKRVNALCWELMYVANKVMVADRQDFTHIDIRHEIMRKVLGYINIGLELGAGGDIAKGEALLNQTWMQSLFQVGYAGVMRLKWEGEKLVKEHGLLLEQVLTPGYMDHLAAAVSRFPEIGVTFTEEPEEAETNIQWRNLESLQDIQTLENFLNLANFYVRFARQSLGLSLEQISQYLEEARFPENKEDLDIKMLTLTALARFALFKEIGCQPLLPEGARSFLQIIFHVGIFKDESRVVNEDIVKAFKERLLTTSLAWTGEDRERLDQLLQECVHMLGTQFGRLDPKKTIEWQFTRGLLLK